MKEEVEEEVEMVTVNSDGASDTTVEIEHNYPHYVKTFTTYTLNILLPGTR